MICNNGRKEWNRNNSKTILCKPSAALTMDILITTAIIRRIMDSDQCRQQLHVYELIDNCIMLKQLKFCIPTIHKMFNTIRVKYG